MTCAETAFIGRRRIPELEHVSTAVLFTDIVDSVRLIEANEKNTVRRWLGFVEQVESSLLPTHRGRLVKMLGDGLLMAFDDAADAVRGAFAFQDNLDRLNADVPQAEKILVRMGLDMGEVLASGESDLMGHRVNVASRLMSLANAGEIVTSVSVRDELVSELDAQFEDMGECYLRNVATPIRAFRVHRPGAQPSLSPIMTEGDLLPTIAVIPFTPRTRSEDHYAIGEVLAEDIIFALSQSADMNVISRLSTTGFRHRGSAVAEIGETLRAEYVLSGAYRQAGGRLIVDIELAEVRSSRVLWTHRLQESAADLVLDPQVLDEVATDIQRSILKREVQRTLSNPMPTLESYSLLMTAVALMHRLSPVEFNIARDLLQTLIDRSSHSPTPQAWMAKWHVLRVQQGWTDDPAREASLARQCTQRALASDPTNVPALVAEGFVLNNLMRRLDEAEERYNEALHHSPNDAVGRLLRGTLYAFRGEGEAAMRDTERALHLAPLDPHRFFFHSLAASACIAAENYPRALDLANRSLRSNRAHTSTLRVKAVAEMRLGRAEEARQTAKELLRLQPDLTVTRWLSAAPSADFQIGRDFAKTLLEAGVPE